MVKVLPPHLPEMPVMPPGMAVHIVPAAHELWLEDCDYYDQSGRDPLQRKQIWGISDPMERVDRLREVLEEYPAGRHRRKILFKAAVRGDDAVVRCVVDAGVKVYPDIQRAKKDEADTQQDGASEHEGIPDQFDPSVVPLRAAAHNRRFECVKIMVESGVNVDVRDELGRTPLIAAAQGGDAEIVRYLLGQGADPTARLIPGGLKGYSGKYEGADALELAAWQGNVENVRMLLEHSVYGSTEEQRNRDDEKPGVRNFLRSSSHYPHL